MKTALVIVVCGWLISSTAAVASSGLWWYNRDTAASYQHVFDSQPQLVAEHDNASLAAPWLPLSQGDFDADGQDDIFWRNRITGENRIQSFKQGQSQGFQPMQTIADTGWQLLAVGDLDGDQTDDQIWQHQTTHEFYALLMQAGQIQREQFLFRLTDRAWRLVAARDLDGDGIADLVFRHQTTGQVYLLTMADGRVKAEFELFTVADLQWQLVAVADMDADGRADLIWRNQQNGDNYVHYMNREQVVAERNLPRVADLNWSLMQVVDLNGDGHADLVWQHQQTQEWVVQLQQQGQIQQELSLLQPPSGWRCWFTRVLWPGEAHAARTVNSSLLHTWWHNNFELNDATPVADAKVRRSTVYEVAVSSASEPTRRFDSFTYLSLPRGGRNKWGYNDEDGADFAQQAQLTMSWSSFEYAADTWVEVSLKDGSSIQSLQQLQIRPQSLQLQVELLSPTKVRILVPYSSRGYRFSVEFASQLYTAYSDLSGVSGQLTVQAAGNRKIHTEPKNALLIFAEPRLTGAAAARFIPQNTDGQIYYPATGLLPNLDQIKADILYFRPGTYYMPWNYHARLAESVRWLYLAPGAVVKGAFQFEHNIQTQYKVTGYGVLSGEKYVYEADTLNAYQHRAAASSDCHGTCVKLLQFSSSQNQQHLDLQGVTLMEPPYHSFVVYGDEHHFSMQVQNYKQVGGWYWQTDGMELYDNSELKDSFIHSNDDVLKLYHNNITINNTLVWKGENGPVFQWGWVPRTIQNIQVYNTDIIHNRMFAKDLKTNTCVINAAPGYKAQIVADPNQWVRDIRLDGIRVEGMINCAMRIFPLANTEHILIKDLHIDAWNQLDWSSQASQLHKLDPKLSISNQAERNSGIRIENYRVNDELISRQTDNWQAAQLGRLNFDAELFDSWDAVK